MSISVLLAAVAACCGFASAWLLISQLRPAELLAWGSVRALPLLRIGTDGKAPDKRQHRQLITTGIGTGFVAGYITSGAAIGAIFAAVGPVALLTFARFRRRQFRAAVRASAPELARALADVLHGGRALRSAVVEVAGSLKGAGGVALRRVANRLDHGRPLDLALIELRDDLKLPEIDTLVAAMLIQRDSGGDLASLLRELADALEARRRLRGDVVTATTQARYTALVVGLLPLGGVVLAELAKPGYILSVVSNPISLVLVVCSGLFQLVGMVLVRKLSKVG